MMAGINVSNVIPFPSRPRRGFPDGWPAGAAGEKLDSFCRDMLLEIQMRGRHDTIEAVRVRGLKMFNELHETVHNIRRRYGAREVIS